MACQHLDQIDPDIAPVSRNCDACVASGDRWVHLRMCMTCGHVGCCDSSVNRHATAHVAESSHPIVRSVEPGEHWQWCYLDEEIVAG
ncbi:MAG: UBP-type zinc finger domain-containing protein [Actinomycetota bacterium]|nr:UBP-type zinc finger domain-containing protein [Actinomycetota bacterium]